MRKLQYFESMEAFETWAESFENSSDYMEIPVCVDDGWKIACDMYIHCKRWKTALKRFENVFSDVHPEIPDWIEGIKEACESGYFKDIDGWKPANPVSKEDIETARNSGTYAWAVEDLGDGLWYIYLNLSGNYIFRGTKGSVPTIVNIRTSYSEEDYFLCMDPDKDEECQVDDMLRWTCHCDAYEIVGYRTIQNPKRYITKREKAMIEFERLRGEPVKFAFGGGQYTTLYNIVREIMEEKNKNMQKLIEQFQKEYDFLYDNCDHVAGYEEAVRAFDHFAKKNQKMIADFVKARGDFIASDREAAAFMFAIESIGL